MDNPPELYYICRDYLGSITHITNASGSLTQELSYDAWGRLRNPGTQVAYAPDSEPALLLGRGYTGHEHLTMFGLINMNARLYDPALGRFLSPDPYVQAPEFSQSFNRYSYCVNNPLKYTDPSGEFFLGTFITFYIDLFDKAFLKGGLDPTSGKARDNAWKSFDPTADWSKTNHAFKIDVGLFITDSNRNFWGRSEQLISRFTWEKSQTLLGKNISQVRNIFGGVDDVSYYGGATLVNKNEEPDKNGFFHEWGFTLGPYINSKNMKADPSTDQMFRHEYGHTLQSQLVGPLYLTEVAIPSLVGCGLEKLGLNDHGREWYETQANRMSYRYFINHAPGALDTLPWSSDDPEYPREYHPEWYWIFAHPPLNFSWWLFF